MKFLFISILLFNVSCSSFGYLPLEFTSENILEIKEGMYSSEILSTYGNPRSIQKQTCGSDTDSPWQCTQWMYGSYSGQYAVFYFADNEGSLILNHFKIER